MKTLRLPIAAVLAALSLTSLLCLAGCSEKGACMMRPPTGQEKEGETCVETTKSVCDQGHDRFVGGKCPDEKAKKK
jgi:hypothetical protein